ncbi:type II toxin-antitoxin system VapC family toxin [Bradyrhizobium sp.]|uniref:type II toxin-antitoxin system VapC family toxin n=1 Tax=Bradyrhizobium sp. TaxID=376 RepID=UPI002C03B11F|nr:type II toxin-antitoxin system VapC family toxin [Bradyrhizobium sp.]HMM89285.1 type II toxin-antitoxin system VapC family toxin [Bradyrhizobium sp.]
MKVTADSNALVRALTEDHPDQSRAAQRALDKAELVALTMPTLCELVWVLRSYKIRSTDIATTIRDLLNASNVAVNRQAAEAGLAQLDAGGDFADGVIAYEGSWLGADTFVSFDKAAVKLMQARGQSVRLLS